MTKACNIIIDSLPKVEWRLGAKLLAGPRPVPLSNGTLLIQVYFEMVMMVMLVIIVLLDSSKLKVRRPIPKFEITKKQNKERMSELSDTFQNS